MIIHIGHRPEETVYGPNRRTGNRKVVDPVDETSAENTREVPHKQKGYEFLFFHMLPFVKTGTWTSGNELFHFTTAAKDAEAGTSRKNLQN
jgi:hypothetical protein